MPRNPDKGKGDGIVRYPTKKGMRYLVRPYDPVTQKRGAGRTFDTLAEARKFKAKASLRQSPRTYETCGQLVDRWLSQGERREATVRSHKQDLKPFLREFQHRRLGDIDRRMAKEFASRHRKAAKVARAAFNFARDEGMVYGNPFAGLNLSGSKGREHIQVITADQLSDLEHAAHVIHGDYGPQFAAAIRFAAYTGLRLGEQLALKWDRIDYRTDRILVAESVSPKGEYTLPKNGEVRTVVLAPQVRAALGAVVRDLNCPYVFRTPFGVPMTQSSAGRLWRPVRAAAGLPNLTWHELRHHAATDLLRRGAPVHLVARQLGHTDKGQRVTWLYLHPEEDLDQIAKLYEDKVVELREVKEDAG